MNHRRSPAGMSGSPVYTEDGKLVGAIAYGFSVRPSAIGGVTPATDILQVFAEGAVAAGQGLAVVLLVPGSRARIVRAEGVAPSSVVEEMGRLRVPVSVCGKTRPEQLGALRDAWTGGRCRRDRHPPCERHRPPGTTLGEARTGRRERRRAD